MKAIALIVAYLALGAAAIAGSAWWLSTSHTAAAKALAASSFDYPAVMPPNGAAPADWKAGHLDGWKWCVQHILDGQVARNDATLRGFYPPDANRAAAFLAGYHAARERFDALVSSEGADLARQTVIRQVRLKPKINDLNVVAMPP